MKEAAVALLNQPGTTRPEDLAVFISQKSPLWVMLGPVPAGPESPGIARSIRERALELLDANGERWAQGLRAFLAHWAAPYPHGIPDQVLVHYICAAALLQAACEVGLSIEADAGT